MAVALMGLPPPVRPGPHWTLPLCMWAPAGRLAWCLGGTAWGSALLVKMSI